MRVLVSALRWLIRAGTPPAVLLAMSTGAARAATVNVFPIPGSRVASPHAQIVIRGVPAGALGRVTVTGSRSGRHRGRIAADSDGAGASYLPSTAFTPGEVVTVSTSQTVLGGKGGQFQFTVAQPAGSIRSMRVTPRRQGSGDIVTFHSRRDLEPARITVLHNATSDAEGDFFVGPQVGPVQDGPMIFDPAGHLVWFAPVPTGAEANNVRVQSYLGHQVLTYWQGHLDLRLGVGTGHDEILDSAYRQVAAVHAANGLSADLHEFELTPAATALITAYFPVYWNASSVHGSSHAVVLDSVVQEIDVRTGLLLFQWDSLDHVPLAATELRPGSPTFPFDYFHVNSVHPDADGSLVVSSRNTWAAYKISRQTGQVIWTLGGKDSSFVMGRGASFAFQHDVRVTGAADSLVTVFDDGAGPPFVHHHSRGLVLALDQVHHTASLASEFSHSPPLLAVAEGDMQPLADGNELVGWGGQPYFTEFSQAGQMVFDARFSRPNTTYRAFRAPWTGTPHTAPSLVATSRGRTATAYASWNGATDYVTWRLLAGPSAKKLSVAGSFPRTGFETRMQVARRAFVAVQALGADGRVLGRSRAVRVR